MKTCRVAVDELDKILYQSFPVLDHGFIRVIDYMGDDSSIVQAARVSYGIGTKKVHEDRGLIRYLMRHRHSTPFEMCEIKFHIKLPIFVARQWIRHRTANVNEYSARYSILDKEFYVPKEEHIASQSIFNNQGRGDIFPKEWAKKTQNLFEEDSQKAYKHYEETLNLEDSQFYDQQRPGLARELARTLLPINFYTQWYWKIDLHNFMHFLSLRADSHAQYEIRVYALQMLEILKIWVPLTYEAFCDYRLNGAFLSKQALDVIRSRLKGQTSDEEKLSLRELEELKNILKD